MSYNFYLENCIERVRQGEILSIEQIQTLNDIKDSIPEILMLDKFNRTEKTQWDMFNEENSKEDL